MRRTSQAQQRAKAFRSVHPLGAVAVTTVAWLLSATGAMAAGEIVDGTAGVALYALNEIVDPNEDLAIASDWNADDADWLDDDFNLESEYADLGTSDPLEKINRGVFAFNEQVDRYALTPLTDIYQALLPQVLRTGINNVFINLDAPVRITNAMLQGRPKESGVAFARFITNTTFGLGGLFEAGERIGLKKQRADFGMTLARWNVPQGPYLIFPFLGPMTVRNGVGTGVDLMMQPVSWVIGPLPGILMGIGKDFSRREQHFLELTSLRESSLDFYASLRSAFMQDRADLLKVYEEDPQLIDVVLTHNEPADPAILEARCLDHPRTRREMAKPALRRGARARCRAGVE